MQIILNIVNHVMRKKTIVKCRDETITVHQDYWMETIENEHHTITFSLCPLHQCCQNENWCDYS